MISAGKQAVLAFGLILAFSGCGEPSPQATLWHLSGETMGTTWHATIRTEEGMPDSQRENVQKMIQLQLDQVDQAMSTYKVDSDVSRFNRASSSEVLSIRPSTGVNLELGLRLAQQTKGAFDPTVLPLVNAWGFGPEKHRLAPPSIEEIQSIKKRVGWQHVLWDKKDQTIRKKLAGVQLDFSAFAKGYGVDAASEFLSTLELKDFLVEVGGELRVRGEKLPGQPWSIGIEKPTEQSMPSKMIQEVLLLTDRAVATSGDYRNFRMIDGKRISHILDPRTGLPTTNNVASVTVLADDCMTADALATALTVLGPKEGMLLLQEHYPHTEALFILRQGDRFTAVQTEKFSPTTVGP